MQATVMAQETSFKDALDYIYVANNVDANTYLITDDNDDDDADFVANIEEHASENSSSNNNNTNNNENNTVIGNDTTITMNTVISDVSAVNMNTLPTTTTTTTTMTTGTPSASLTAAAAAAATALLSNANSNAAAAATTVTNTTTTVAATAAATFAAMATDAAGINFAGVAVGLGAMLINDTLLMDVNGTSGYLGEIINGTYYTTTINSSIDNVTSSDEDFTEMLKMVATSVILGLMILITIIGNVFVIAAIILERNLQNVANYLVASLAVADLLVACLVMPLGAVYEISNGWILGPELCDIWTSCDVLCCTASILHLVAIAMDRYWAVTNIDYIHSRTSRRVFMMIFCVWSAAVIVSLAPQFGWKDPDYLQRIEQQKCMVSQDIAYQVFATCCTFYVPLLVILALYWKIYQTARKRIHRRRPKPVDVTANNNQPDGSAPKKRKHLRLRFGRFATDKANADAGSSADAGDVAAPSNATALCIVEGNSTNTVNTVEDTEFSSSNVDNKSRAGIEVPTTSSSQISTVSHLVALANQQHVSSTKQLKPTNAVGQKHQTANVAESTTETLDGNTVAALTATTTLTTSAENGMESTVTEATANNSAGTFSANVPTKFTIVESTGTVNGSGAAAIEVLADPQLQQQLEQVQRQQQQQQQQQSGKMSATKSNATAGGATTSNATTITSISALSPQTPPGATNMAAAASTSSTMTAGGAATSTTTTTTGNTLTSGNQTIAPPLCSSSANASGQVTPVPRAKQQQQLSSIDNPMQKVNKRKETLEAKRERKAAKTLAIITGAFVVCWLPFFVMAITMPLCASCEISDGVSSLFLWLGYFNSTLNPVIYTIFSPEFRQAFKRILFGGHRPVHYRSGKL